MPVLLPPNGNGRRHALIAHGLWIGFVVFTRVVDFVADGCWWQAVVAFYLGRVHGLAFQFLLGEPVVEADVSDVADEAFVDAVDAFSPGAVLAHGFLE
jgi:hypothetical protein